ncbi:GNAT family N-acetyltransferase [Streptomyces erythrogriseus]|uniref:GNAT family N-acetyltransferase n=1 Tax=Streptomyces erythrogriseus TaxID=284027 RepID=UPI0031F9893C
MALQEYTPASLREIVGDDRDPFEVSALGLTWRPKEQHFGIRANNRLVAHAGWVAVPVSVAGTTLQVAGLGGVIVAPELQGRGLARLVVSAAMAQASAQGLQFGLLFCRPDRVPVYRKMGWTPLPTDVVVQQPGGNLTMPLPTMWTSLGAAVPWPPGAVRLLSLPM